ncbi:MAG: MFS transporter [Candidatus Competibacteraceae bacterium]|jgi:MFS family permease/HAMP domain-containing protein|nr:MFS transporter [Candidatus Competibacteraceae bacterium]
MTARRIDRPLTGLLLITAVLVILPLAGLSAYSLRAFERELLPELDKKALTVGLFVNSKIERALDFGIPFDKLEGMSEFFAPILATNEDISYLAVTDLDGTVRYQWALPDDQRQSLAPAAAEAQGIRSGLPIPQYSDPLAPLAALLGREQAEHNTQARVLGNFHNTALPIEQGDELVGVLHVGANQRFAVKQMRDIVFDIGIVFVVALLAAFELLLLVVTLNFSEPLRRVHFVMSEAAKGNFNHRLAMRTRTQIGHLGRQLDSLIERVNQGYTSLMRPAAAAQQTRVLDHLQHRFTFAQDGAPKVYRQSVLLGIRAATFLFMFAEEIARPFLPLYVREFTTPFVGISQDLLISLPLSAFMLGVALTMPFAGPWCERIGYRKAFVSGAALASAGLVGTGIATGFYDLIAWRVCAAIGYAIMFAACQGYVVEKTQADNRAQGIAVFVGGIMVAAICGPAIGGMLADRIGYTWTFFVGAALAACSAWLAYGLMTPGARRHSPQTQRSGIQWADFKVVLSEPRFVVLMLFAAVPAKLLLSGFLFFLVPLLLTHLGSNQAEIGRIVMTYGLANVVLMSLCARFADRLNAHGFMVGSGGVIAGTGMIPMIFFPNSSLVLLGVVLLGVGQAMSISSQLVLATQVCHKQIAAHGQGAVLGLYRFIERLGGAAGPFVVAGFVTLFGYVGAMMATGILGVLTATLFSVLFLIMGVVPEEDDQDEDDFSPAQASA